MASNEEKDKPHDSGRMFDQVCSPCKCQERTTTAAKFCADCQDYYCLECVKVHNNFPALAGHSVLDKGHFKTGTSKPISMVPTERCESHNFKPVDMYCQNHDDIGCSTCIAVEHRSCQDVFYIPEYVQNNNLTIEFETVQREMLSVVGILKDQLDNYQREVKRLHKRKEEEVEKIKSFRVQIDRKLDRLEKSSIDEIEKSYQALIKKMHIDICALTTSQEDVHSSQDRISSAGPNTSQRFVRTIRGKTAKDEAEKRMKEKREECTTIRSF